MLHDLARECAEFEAVHGRYPLTLEELCRPDSRGRTYSKARKPPRDPWRREDVYAPPDGRGGELLIYTLGVDGEPGGEGRDEDVFNHGRGAQARIGERPRTIP